MPERKPYPRITAQPRIADSTTDPPTGSAETTDGLPITAKPMIMRLAPGIWAILHPAGLCLWSGDSHGAAWEHVDNGPLRRERPNFTRSLPKTRDTEFHTQGLETS